MVGWLALWAVLALWLPTAAAMPLGIVAAVLVGAAALARPVRVRWRPVSGPVAVHVSRTLRPGDRAWFVRPGDAELVLVTGRRGLRLVVAFGARGPAEGIPMRRTRVLVIPADAPSG